MSFRKRDEGRRQECGIRSGIALAYHIHSYRQNKAKLAGGNMFAFESMQREGVDHKSPLVAANFHPPCGVSYQTLVSSILGYSEIKFISYWALLPERILCTLSWIISVRKGETTGCWRSDDRYVWTTDYYSLATACSSWSKVPDIY